MTLLIMLLNTFTDSKQDISWRIYREQIPWLAIRDSGCVHRRRCDAERSSLIPYPSTSGQHSYSPGATLAPPYFPLRPPCAGLCGQIHPAGWPHSGSVKTRIPAAALRSDTSVPPPHPLRAAVSGIWRCSSAVQDSSWSSLILHSELSSLLFYESLSHG